MENTPPPPQPEQPQPPYGVEHTQPLHSYDPAGPPPTQHWAAPPPAPARRSRGLVAGVLAGALVLGGAAGIGGAALYDVVTDEPSASSTSGTDSGTFAPSNDTPVASGSVEKVAQQVLPSVVKVNVTGPQGAGSGSGIVLSKDGKILTNNHVVTGAGDGAQITVTFNDGTTKRATVTGTDPITDVAVLQAQGASGLTPAKLGRSSDLRVGQTVVAVGAPFGLESTVTSGIVSALNRPVSVSAPEQQSPFGEPEPQDLSTTYPAIQTDAAINPGNSGGPLVDMSGRVVGINSSIRTSGTDLTGGQGGSIGLGFAIPIDEVLPIVNQIVDGETPTHARLGVTVSDVSGNGLTRGARIRSVEDGAAAASAGLRSGDVVTKVDDQVIDSSESLVATIRGHRPGDRVRITYVRGGDTRTVTAQLGSDASTRSS